ncbi:NADPH-cytochrome P450 reductase [Coccidioides posadasii str. Silveira]|uniref:NADPH--cytochrome P450 reductase n=2 Tax=Coccidioides posadasii TaxID=199306 RepID=E9D5S5_COCPS|nr:NADPH cytochrome P450 reductase, putative [Coccidioides posadasii C735 delta SOWgp]EER24576.1 NADPH cytochrome P450 reductase, putative [Coccidioides posadasii C735 delta SOWgp]EFW18269.1 NADPH-cytochrome P450 reductase [Coccidioides posadasii str. Silveira]QVM10429.1 NADPH-cytochrome P450 reductase [Coccidioides posadasii str. Silveira]|eukprot:XP_003066721.1 NADPH cytochrome P450 reductase, putative [Coccidioides posadasii C735 delta SOWgp]
MAQVDSLDLVVLTVLLVGSVAYFTKGTYWGVPKAAAAASYGSANGMPKEGKTRNIIEKMDETGKNCVVFFGSQTGTAEDYASRLAKEGAQRFGLKTMVADLEDYDFENLDQFPEDKVAFFVLATYGEGEPTDNAVDFYQFMTGEDVSFEGGASAEEKPLSSLRYVTFGLGNNTYEHYNAMVRQVDAALTKLGAKRIGTAGEGDDGSGTMEEDYLAWKEPMWKALSEEMGLEEREAVYEPTFCITEEPTMSPTSENVYVGEPNQNHLEGNLGGSHNAHNPFIAPITESRELFTVKDRNCLHLDIGIQGSTLNYQTGDHLAVWPTNAGKEVDRFLQVFGLEDKRHTVVKIKPIDVTAKVPFPTPTTYDAAVRYYMEICGPVSRQFIATLAQFAPDEDTKSKMKRLGEDKDHFHGQISTQFYNIAQALQSITSKPFTSVPFSLLIEGISKLQPRYYSISSSSMVQKDRISITTVVESIRVPGAGHVMKGVTTNYLLALKQKQHGDANPDPHGLTYEITGPRNKYDGIHVPVHVRHSNFKLPSDPSKPIIMVGPGTGVAPFRGFIQERVAQAERGDKVGPTVLFFGCRNRDEDFLYKDEWEAVSEKLGDNFKLFTAFSRESEKKVYVQHRLRENAVLVNELLKNKATFYVCGDAANMAREVNTILGQIISEQRGLPLEKGEEFVKNMRNMGMYQEDVWS